MRVKLEHLTKIFPIHDQYKTPTLAASDLDFEIEDGTLVGLLGPSGCGKSTTLNLISGLETPTEGRIYFGDEDITDLPAEKRGVGLVFQNYALYPHLTVLKNIIFPLENLKGDQKLDKQTMIKKAYEVAKLVQIDELMDRKPSQLSGGQQQRVAIARALVKMPKVLLLDEPLSNLDARLRLQTRVEIRRIQQETGITTVFVTHDQEEAMSICDKIVVMKSGAVHQIDKPQSVYDNPVNLFVAKFLGTPQINVFNGFVKDGSLFIGKDEIMKVEGVDDQDVHVAIRPEGFIVNENGAFHCELTAVEVMGRDTSIVCQNENNENIEIRVIVSTDDCKEVKGKYVNFDIKPSKMYLFEKESEKRIYL